MDLATELQKMYDSEIHVDISWLWDGGIDVNIGNDEVRAKLEHVADILPWLQKAIGNRYPASRYNVERLGGKWEPKFYGPRPGPFRVK